jgi:hypothetical protein
MRGVEMLEFRLLQGEWHKLVQTITLVPVKAAQCRPRSGGNPALGMAG